MVAAPGQPGFSADSAECLARQLNRRRERIADYPPMCCAGAPFRATLGASGRIDPGVVMARQVITTLIDDLDGKKADRTVEFSLDGVNYAIDLSEANAGNRSKALDPCINAATRLGRSGRIPARRTALSRTASSRDENRLIRE